MWPSVRSALAGCSDSRPACCIYSCFDIFRDRLNCIMNIIYLCVLFLFFLCKWWLSHIDPYSAYVHVMNSAGHPRMLDSALFCSLFFSFAAV